MNKQSKSKEILHFLIMIQKNLDKNANKNMNAIRKENCKFWENILNDKQKKLNQNLTNNKIFKNMKSSGNWTNNIKYGQITI